MIESKSQPITPHINMLENKEKQHKAIKLKQIIVGSFAKHGGEQHLQ